MLQMMIQNSHIDIVDDDPTFTYCCCKRCSSVLIERLIMKMHDVVPKIPMTYRDSPVSCTFAFVVAADEEYLPS